ncbi:glycosyltransferase family 4 protein [Gimesia fumaroli]|uniref:Teichuronic acid biosynthesis glycosyltransferase TuaC n=1 Tax=Gimesia fumaroli TaxID=2527976 RepID=A0A518IKS5_9PLAN|nr:glycosyltransferase family 4 protein [Gimesia fumaroli]QDV53691.1 Putative teichuronic acid biosynthesis glycosyltransferase TuaC [Gimesia fumaroli]
MISTKEKQQLCQSCPHRRNYYCQRHDDEVKRVIKNRETCEGWGNVPKPEAKPATAMGETIRLGFCMPNMAMGGVTRLLLTMMNAQVKHGFEWSGVAIGDAAVFDMETAKRVLQHCPIYCTVDDPKFEGLVTIVSNACQTIVDQSDVVNFWGYIESNAEIDSTDWDAKPMLVVSHGQCEWTRKNLAVSFSKGSKHIPVAVSEAAAESYLDLTQDDVRVIYNAVEFSRCAPARDRDEVRREWGIAPGVKAVGFIGRFAMDKNPMATAKAVAELGEGYHAVYVGEGWQSEQVIAEAKALCGDRLTVIPRVEDVGTVLAALDCVVTAATYEGGPLVAAEAWLAGCPVVSTPSGMIPELERDHGLLTYGVSNDPTNRWLKNAVLAALEGDERVERARKLAWNLFSPGRMVLAYEAAIRDALKPQPVEVQKRGFIENLKGWLKCWSTAG